MSDKGFRCTAIFAATMGLGQPAITNCPSIDPADQRRIEALIARMTVTEKVAQLRFFHANADAQILGGETAIMLGSNGKLILPPEMEARFANRIAGIKNPGETNDPVSAAKLTNALQAKIMAASPNRIPALFVAEA